MSVGATGGPNAPTIVTHATTQAFRPTRQPIVLSPARATLSASLSLSTPTLALSPPVAVATAAMPVPSVVASSVPDTTSRKELRERLQWVMGCIAFGALMGELMYGREGAAVGALVAWAWALRYLD